MSQVICSKAKECKSDCGGGHNKPHEHREICKLPCQTGNIEDAVCVPVPELMICARSKECNHLIGEEKDPCGHWEAHQEKLGCHQKWCDHSGISCECIPYVEPAEPEAQYCIYVDGKSAPRVFHLDKSIAHTEAERLARMQDNIGRKVYILEATEYVIAEPNPVKWHTIGGK